MQYHALLQRHAKAGSTYTHPRHAVMAQSIAVYLTLSVFSRSLGSLSLLGALWEEKSDLASLARFSASISRIPSLAEAAELR